jgi:orotate phosphoribosyltransferase
VDARDRLIALLREHSLIVGEVVLTSGRTASYYVDARRAILRPDGFAALGELVAERATAFGATAVGGLTMGADPVACAALAAGFRGTAFLVRKEAKQHGLARRIEAGGSTLAAIAALRDAGLEVCGVIAVLDRLMGGRDVIEAAAGAPFVALSTIDDVYPDRDGDP